MTHHKQFLVILLVAVIGVIPTTANPALRFGSKESRIDLLNNSTLTLVTTMTNDGGTIQQRESSSIQGNDIIFINKGIYQTDLSDLTLAGNYRTDPSGTGTIVMNGSITNPQRFRATPGLKTDLLEVSGNYNRLEGSPFFNNPVRLMDTNTTLTIAIESILNQNIELNGGTLILEEDLTLADSIYIKGPGTISLNNRRMAFGSQDLVLNDSLHWVGAADLFLNGRIDLTGSWTFEDECYLNGDSVPLNLIGDASLTIKDNSKLFVKQLKIAGLGGRPNEGKIYFEDEEEVSTSEFYLRRAALEFTSTYTFQTGHVIIESGASDFITKNNIVYFERRTDNLNDPPSARLTVDKVYLYYKTRIYFNNNNIRAVNEMDQIGSTEFNTENSAIKINSPGDIVHYGSFASYQLSVLSSYNGGLLLGNIHLPSYITKLEIKDDGVPRINGVGNYIHFSHTERPFLFVEVDAELTNIVLKNLTPKHIAFEPEDKTLIFDNNVTIEMDSDIEFIDSQDKVVTWTFKGSCRIDGKGKNIDFNVGGIRIPENSTLTLEDMVITNLKTGSLDLESDSSKIIFKNVRIYLAEDTHFDKGQLSIDGKVEFRPSNTMDQVQFIYETNSSAPLEVRDNSMLHFDNNVTFRYAPGAATNNLLSLEEKTSILSLNGGTLSISDAGLQLTKGTLRIDHKCRILSDATSIGEAIIFGDGVSVANDLDIDILPGGNIDVQSGIVEYKNISG